MLSHRGTNSARSLVPGCSEVLGGPNRIQSLHLKSKRPKSPETPTKLYEPLCDLDLES